MFVWVDGSRPVAGEEYENVNDTRLGEEKQIENESRFEVGKVVLVVRVVWSSSIVVRRCSFL